MGLVDIRRFAEIISYKSIVPKPEPSPWRRSISNLDEPSWIDKFPDVSLTIDDKVRSIAKEGFAKYHPADSPVSDFIINCISKICDSPTIPNDALKLYQKIEQETKFHVTDDGIVANIAIIKQSNDSKEVYDSISRRMDLQKPTKSYDVSDLLNELSHAFASAEFTEYHNQILSVLISDNDRLPTYNAEQIGELSRGLATLNLSQEVTDMLVCHIRDLKVSDPHLYVKNFFETVRKRKYGNFKSLSKCLEYTTKRRVFLRLIDEGGFRYVFEIIHETMGPLAFKINKKEYELENEQARRIFQRLGEKINREEISNLKKLNHPHLSRLYWGDPYYDGRVVVYEELADTSLRAYLSSLRQSGINLPPDQMNKIMENVFNVLNYLHHKGFIHCDVKPPNILLNLKSDNSIDIAVLSDLQTAKRIGQKATYTGLTHGTSCYVDPLAVYHNKLNVQSDIYSLGMILLEFILGYQPFEPLIAINNKATEEIVNIHPDNKADLAKVCMIYEEKARELHSEIMQRIMPEIPSVFLPVMMKAIAFNPEKRYESISAFRTEYGGALKSFTNL